MIYIFEPDGITNVRGACEELMRYARMSLRVDNTTATPGVTIRCDDGILLRHKLVLLTQLASGRYGKHFEFEEDHNQYPDAIVVNGKKPVVRITEDDKDYARLVS